MPSTSVEWIAIADKFNELWNFPNCIGAVDGKHVVMVAPPNSGSIYFNYKRGHSIVLMAVCDAQYRFIYIDVGTNGRESDGSTFRNSSFVAAMESGSLNFPPPKPLPGRENAMPYALVADAAFSLSVEYLFLGFGFIHFFGFINLIHLCHSRPSSNLFLAANAHHRN